MGCAMHSQPPAPGNGTYPFIVHGSDAPADSATTAHFSNHVALNVRNLNASIDFYSRVLGFRHLFTFQLTPHYSFTYLGHASGGKNGSGYQTNCEMIREKNNRQGLIELIFLDTPDARANLTSTTQTPNTFSHIGVVVPDLAVAVTRFQDIGAPILFKPGDALKFGDEVLKALGLGTLKEDNPEAQLLVQFLGLTGQGLMYLEDPDGNMIEIYPEVESVDFGLSSILDG
ncbi:hypothetical protein GQ53DRAFT_853734 [Thozetella sp. PMI_491]|nr:hypothetical protein GQ53DRAFT_853734 [Thozetella sp. PMI_491]